MPAKRKNRSDRVGGALIRRINVSKAVTGLRDQSVAGAMQCARGTLAKRKRDPLTFTLGELLRLEAAFGWTAEDWTYILRTSELKGVTHE